MTKKGPLGKAELFYVKEHCQTLDAKEIAKELDRPIATVRSEARNCRGSNGSQGRRCNHDCWSITNSRYQAIHWQKS